MMNDEEFESMCNSAARMSFMHISLTFPERAEELLERLGKILNDPDAALSTFTDFLLMSVAADGILAIEEFMLLRPFFNRLTGKYVEYDEALQIFMEKGFNNLENFRNTYEKTKSLFERVGPEFEQELVSLFLMVLAADGHITDDEKIWLKNLIIPAEKFDVDAAISEVLTHRHSARLNRRH